MKLNWTAGACSVKGCRMTMVTYVGGGQWWCWLHALVEGLVDAAMRKERP
jgi:hypothetical protein